MALDIQAGDTEGISTKVLKDSLDSEVKKVNDALTAMQNSTEDISIVDMFSLQMLVNHMAQTSESYTSVVSSMNTSIGSMARNVK